MPNLRLRLRKSKVEAKAKVEKKLNLSLNLDLHEVRKPQPLFQNLNLTFDIGSLMNICIITSSFPSHPDDIVQAPFLVDFIEGLKKRGHQVYVFTQDREGEKEEFLKG